MERMELTSRIQIPSLAQYTATKEIHDIRREREREREYRLEGTQMRKKKKKTGWGRDGQRPGTSEKSKSI